MQGLKDRWPSAEMSAFCLLIFGTALLVVGFTLDIRSRFGRPTQQTLAEAIIPTQAPDSAISRAPHEAALPPASTTHDANNTEAGLTDDQFGRIGVSGSQAMAAQAWQSGLRWSQTLDWDYKRDPQLPADVTFLHTLRITEDGWGNFDTWDEVLDEVRRHPGQVWIIGNEPDVKWQDGVSAEIFADRYHEAFARIKAVDITAQVAVGAVSAGTELRLRYLDQVLAIYEQKYGMALPTDMWTLHAYVLREERDSWGIDIPPGLDAEFGDLYEIDDHDDLDLFLKQIVAFRRWMSENGYRDRPLSVTEFGILLPNDYGFPPEVVAQYMRDTYTIMLNEQDAQIGYPSDDNRLVQSMFWFIFHYDQYPTGAIWDIENGKLTPLGEELQSFIGR